MVKGVLQTETPWSEEGINWLYRFSGGHPYFAKLLLDRLLTVCRERGMGEEPKRLPDDRSTLDLALSGAVNDPRANHAVENLYQAQFTNEEKEVILLLAQWERPLNQQELRQAGKGWRIAARRLVKRHYLAEIDNSYTFHLAFLGPWLQNWIEFEEECERLSELRRHLAEPPEIEVHEATRQVLLRGRAVKISGQEYRIMRALAFTPGILVPRQHLIAVVWGAEEGVSDQTVDTAVYRLRKKLKDKGQYIETVAGQGFILHRAALIK